MREYCAFLLVVLLSPSLLAIAVTALRFNRVLMSKTRLNCSAVAATANREGEREHSRELSLCGAVAALSVEVEVQNESKNGVSGFKKG